jgi:transglutaminase-like putative cysteine protease
VTDASTNPDAIAMAQDIERYLNFSLYLLVLTGFGALASTGGLDLPAVLLVGFALALRGFQLFTGTNFAIPERWTTVLTVLYIVIYLVDYLFLSRSFLGATIHLVLFASVVRLFSLQRPRDHYMLAVLSFLMVLAAAVLTIGSLFLFAFAVFVLVAIVTFVLMEMRHSVASEGVRARDSRIGAPGAAYSGVASSSRRMAFGLLAIAPALMLTIFAGGFLIFFMLPRVSSHYLSAYSSTSDVSTGFTDSVQLGRIGQIQQSSAVVMHIAIDNDLQGAYDLKWRGIALSNFDGQVWSNSFEQTRLPQGADGVYRLAPLPIADHATTVSGRSIRYRVTMEPIGTNVFFLAERPQSLSGSFRNLSTDAGGAVYDLDGDRPIVLYRAESRLADIDVDELRLAENISPASLQEYLELPPLDVRISKLAQEIATGAPSNYDKAVALERYLSTHFGYTLELPRSHPRDPIANFLFERKKGHCEFFSSAMAVMLRSLRIPSRIVTGFRGGEFNDLTGQYVVRASDAHSWVEAYFPGSGWISFDPTPAGSVPVRTFWSRLRLYVDAAASFWREWIINYDVYHQRSLGRSAANNLRQTFDGARRWIEQQHEALLRSARRAHDHFINFPEQSIRWPLGIGVLLFVLPNLRRAIRILRDRTLRAHPERAPRESAALWYDRMVDRLARRGWRKSPSQTPLDFVAAIQEAELQRKVASFTRAYESARFGESVDDAQSLPALFEEITDAETASARK